MIDNRAFSLPSLVLFSACIAPSTADGKSAPCAYLEPPPGRILHLAGHISQAAEFREYLGRLGPDLQPVGENVWVGLDGARPWPAVMTMVRNQLDRLATAGRIANLSFGFVSATRHREFGTALDERFVETSDYDARVDELAQAIRRSGTPVMLRIGGEVNGRWNGHHPYVFPRAYRKVVDRFRAQGVRNVAFVFCVEPHGDPDVFAVDRRGAPKWYPGDAYVDWLGIDLFRVETFRGRASFAERFLAEARRRGKPVLVGESSPHGHVVPAPAEDRDGSGADAIWREWFEPFVAFLDAHPEIKAVDLMPMNWSRTRSWPDWGDARIHRNQRLFRRWRRELGKPRWVHRTELAGVVELLPEGDGARR